MWVCPKNHYIGEMISAQTYTKEYWRKYSFLLFVKNVEHDKIELV